LSPAVGREFSGREFGRLLEFWRGTRPVSSGEDFREFLLRGCHDLRTPLRAVRANAELLLKHPEKRAGAGYEQILGFIIGGAEKIDSLVEGLSSYSLALHVEAGAFQPAPTGVLLRAVLAKLAAELSGSGAEVTGS
jgi:light-regulated signal transduction histidine kinase (bacteriophytochrome)